MKTIFLKSFVGIILIFFASCNTQKEKQINWDELISNYSQRKDDSLKLQAAIFLKENMSDITSEKLIFYNTQTGKEANIRIDTIYGDSELLKIMRQQNISVKTEKVYDTLFVTNGMLETNIDKAVADWDKYPWNNNVPKDIFLNYLLPYKVLDEYPEDWRSYFYEKYKDSISERINKYLSDTSNIYFKNPNDLFYQIIVGNAEKWFKYDADFTPLSRAPSLNVLLCMRQGDCSQESYLNTYILRSLGIPATIDMVPMWGSRNAGHVSEIFWDGKNKMRAASGRSLERAAKVFRLSFKKQNLWKDSIQPFIGKSSFLLPYLQNNHWLDATSEHTKITNINYTLQKNIQTPFCYICVYNYGEWLPIYWGRIYKNNQTVFRNMGCNMLYRIAIPTSEGYKIVSSTFEVDSTGKIFHKTPDYKIRRNLNLTKLNTGSKSWVGKGKNYALYYLDKKDIWRESGIQTCIKDSIIIFKNIPSNAFYRLIDVNGNKRLERIFTYENQKQIWW